MCGSRLRCASLGITFIKVSANSTTCCQVTKRWWDNQVRPLMARGAVSLYEWPPSLTCSSRPRRLCLRALKDKLLRVHAYFEYVGANISQLPSGRTTARRVDDAWRPRFCCKEADAELLWAWLRIYDAPEGDHDVAPGTRGSAHRIRPALWA